MNKAIFIYIQNKEYYFEISKEIILNNHSFGNLTKITCSDTEIILVTETGSILAFYNVSFIIIQK